MEKGGKKEYQKYKKIQKIRDIFFSPLWGRWFGLTHEINGRALLPASGTEEEEEEESDMRYEIYFGATQTRRDMERERKSQGEPYVSLMSLISLFPLPFFPRVISCFPFPSSNVWSWFLRGFPMWQSV